MKRHAIPSVTAGILFRNPVTSYFMQNAKLLTIEEKVSNTGEDGRQISTKISISRINEIQIFFDSKL